MKAAFFAIVMARPTIRSTPSDGPGDLGIRSMAVGVCQRILAGYGGGSKRGMTMTLQNPARIEAAIALADAILAEFNDPDGKVRFSVPVMEKLLAYRKIAEKKPRGRRAKAESSADDDASPTQEPEASS
jgi:hypothetical protein